MKALCLGLSLWATVALSAHAEETPTPVAETAPAPAPAPPAAPAPIPALAPPVAPAPIVALSGTPVIIEITQEVSSKTAKKGDHFTLRLGAPVKMGDQVVLPAGVTGVGEVIDASPAGLGGRPGELLLAARYLDYQGRKIALRGFKIGLGGQGTDNMSTSMLVGLLPGGVGLIGILVQGGNITYPSGLTGTAKLNEDVSLESPLTPPPAAPAGPSAPAAPAAPAAVTPVPVAN